MTAGRDILAREMKRYQTRLASRAENTPGDTRDEEQTCNNSDCVSLSGIVDWIFCDFCKKWCHNVCENIPPKDGDTVDTYKCVACSGFDSDSVFPSTTGLSQAFSMCTLDDATESELIVESSLADFEHANNMPRSGETFQSKM